MDADLIEHAAKNVGQRRFVLVNDVASTLDPATATAAKKYGQGAVVMHVAVADTGAIEQHGIVEQIAVAVRGVAKLAEEIGDLLDVASVDAGDFGLFFGIV